MKKGEVKVFSDIDDLAHGFAEFFKTFVNSHTSKVNIALSGGSTPKTLFKLFSESYVSSIHWRKIHFFWGDERCVRPSDKESNYKMTKDFLFEKIRVPQANIHRIHGEENPENEARRYSEHLQNEVNNYDGLPQFDLIILGMGEDGHTASIFPNEMHLLHSSKVCEVGTHPESGQKRITLTGNVINNAKNVTFLVSGKGKYDMLSTLMDHLPYAENLPAFHIQPSGNLYWFVDSAAMGNNEE